MSRNYESHFSVAPQADIPRSTFDRSSDLKCSFDIGSIIPTYCEEILPGDTYEIRTNKLVRLQTMLTPMMDNIVLDTYYFFVPNRLVWEHWKNFCGENTASAWYPTTEYTVPKIAAPSGGWNVGTIADFLGIPPLLDDIEVNALPFRAYALICNEFFRDENLSDPLVIPVNDSKVTGSNGSTFVSDVAKGGMPYKAAKLHDYFTSALPAPQKGPDVGMPFDLDLGGQYPVITGESFTPDSSAPTLTFYNSAPVTAASSNLYYTPFFTQGSYYSVSNAPVNTSSNASNTVSLHPANGNYSMIKTYIDTTKTIVPNNLYADLDAVSGNGTEVLFTINQLRQAFQIQRLYERDARGGSRYIEILKSHFGVTSPDYRLQRPEYLGGNRVDLNVNQVIQSSQTATTPQGTPTAYSLTTDSHGDFIKSFTEHGILMGVAVARYKHSYQQGIDRMMSRSTRFSYYWPVLANLGEQAILNKEIYAQGSTVINSDTGKAYDDEVFGYQEAWAEYRYKPDRVAGEMRSVATTSLDIWHLADDYSALPALSSSWIQEDATTVDRVLAVKSTVSNQLFGDFYVDCKAVRPIPLYSVPGLIDHL